MRVSRAPEYRGGGGGGSPVLLLLVLVAILVVGGVVAYLLLGPNAPGQTQSQANAVQQPAPPPAGSVNTPPSGAPPQISTPVPVAAVPVATTAPSNTMAQAGDCEPEPPRIAFGEVLAAGFVDLRVNNEDINSWYTLQVDTGTTTTTFFFAFFGPSGCAVSRTALVRNYTPTELIDNVEITVYYPDASERSITFDQASGTIISRQFYNADAFEPALFSAQTRISLSQQNLELVNDDSSIRAQTSLDLTSLSNQEGISIRQDNPPVVQNVLSEVQMVLDQIESRRDR